MRFSCLCVGTSEIQVKLATDQSVLCNFSVPYKNRSDFLGGDTISCSCLGVKDEDTQNTQIKTRAKSEPNQKQLMLKAQK